MHIHFKLGLNFASCQYFVLSSQCSILPLSLDNNERFHTHGGAVRSQNCLQELTSAKILELPRNPHAMLIFHYSRLTSMQRLFFIGRGLHPLNACFSLTVFYNQATLFFSLAIVYTHVMHVFYWSQLTPTHLWFPVIVLFILWTAGCICEQHPPGSFQMMYYTSITIWKLTDLGYKTLTHLKYFHHNFFFTPNPFSSNGEAETAFNRFLDIQTYGVLSYRHR